MTFTKLRDVFCPVCGKEIRDEIIMKENPESEEESCVIECEYCEIVSVIYMNPFPLEDEEC